MSVLEITVYVLFFVLILFVLIAIYFYNKRHIKSFFQDENIFYEHQNKDMKIEFEKNRKFEWNIYEDELTIEDKKFIGLDIWESTELALKRIDELNEQYITNEFVFFNLIEILILIDLYGSEIKISDLGEFLISKLYLSSFIQGLSYDIKTIQKIDEIKKEYLSSISEIEIDAKEIFFIMKNAKSFGLGNVDNHIQFFQFVNKNKSSMVIDQNIIEFENENQIKIVVNDDYDDANNLMHDKDILVKDHKGLHEILNSYKKELQIETIDNGLTKITFEDGTVVIKNGPWEIVEVITLEDLKNKKEEELKESKNNTNVEVRELIDKISIDKNEVYSVQKNIDTPKTDVFDDLLLIKPLDKNIYLNTVNGEISFYGFLEGIKNETDFEECFFNLNAKNLLDIISILFSKDFLSMEIDNFNNTKIMKRLNFFFTDGNKYYLVYEYVIFIILSLVKDKDILLNDILVGIESFSMRYPSKLVSVFIKLYKNLFGNDIFFEVEDKHFFYKTFFIKNDLFRANLMILNDKFIEHLKQTNPQILDGAKNISVLSKEDVAKVVSNKKNIFQFNFKIFKNWNYNGK